MLSTVRSAKYCQVEETRVGWEQRVKAAARAGCARLTPAAALHQLLLIGRPSPTVCYRLDPALAFDLIKKKIKFSSYIMKFTMEQLQKSYMTNGVCAFPQILGRPSSYMTLQLLPAEFPFIYEEI
jgi:hypothetical protein